MATANNKTQRNRKMINGIRKKNELEKTFLIAPLKKVSSRNIYS